MTTVQAKDVDNDYKDEGRIWNGYEYWCFVFNFYCFGVGKYIYEGEKRKEE